MPYFTFLHKHTCFITLAIMINKFFQCIAWCSFYAWRTDFHSSWVSESVPREDRLWLKKLSVEVERHRATRGGLGRTGRLTGDTAFSTLAPWSSLEHEDFRSSCGASFSGLTDSKRCTKCPLGLLGLWLQNWSCFTSFSGSGLCQDFSVTRAFTHASEASG